MKTRISTASLTPISAAPQERDRSPSSELGFVPAHDPHEPPPILTDGELNEEARLAGTLRKCPARAPAPTNAIHPHHERRAVHDMRRAGAPR